VHVGDGRRGWPPGAPYDRIVVTACAAEIHREWFDQLAPDGLLEVPLALTTGSWGPQSVVTFEKCAHGFRSVRQVPGGFMTLRPQTGADATDVPRLTIDLRGMGRPPSTIAVAGDAVARLSDAARRRLVGVLAQRPRSRVVARGPDSAGGLVYFVALATPPPRRVESGGMWGTGIVDASGGGVAFLTGRSVPAPKDNPPFGIRAYGTLGAERELFALVREWRSIGRPTWKQLRIGVTFGGRRPRAWRSSARGGSILSFDWSARDRRN
jgi:protein-L-isoaspartate(D-aspartate) O-methyltransferase